MPPRPPWLVKQLLSIVLILAAVSSRHIVVSATSSVDNEASRVLKRVVLRDAETGEPLSNINNVVVHNESVYVGAENVLVRLDARDLRTLQTVRVGPVLDSAMCRYAPREECLYSRRKSLTPNYNKLVLVMERERALLVCWTAFQGVCEMRDLDDLSVVRANSSVAVVANDAVNSTIAFQATSPNSQRLLYVATTYTSLGAYRDDVPALAGRSLQPHRFMQLIESNNQLKTGSHINNNNQLNDFINFNVFNLEFNLTQIAIQQFILLFVSNSIRNAGIKIKFIS